MARGLHESVHEDRQRSCVWHDCMVMDILGMWHRVDRLDRFYDYQPKGL